MQNKSSFIESYNFILNTAKVFAKNLEYNYFVDVIIVDFDHNIIECKIGREWQGESFFLVVCFPFTILDYSRDELARYLATKIEKHRYNALSRPLDNFTQQETEDRRLKIYEEIKPEVEKLFE